MGTMMVLLKSPIVLGKMMNKTYFLLDLLAIVFGSMAIVVSAFSIALFIYLGSYSILFFIMILNMIFCGFLVRRSSTRIFDFIRRHGIS
jgi:FtsH-binding integral membrane protein